MQPAIHQEKNPDIYRFDVRLFVVQCIVGCIFYSVGLIIPRKSPCIKAQKASKTNITAVLNLKKKQNELCVYYENFNM
jgi:hypothetical protein